jgi:nitrogen fixation-related uncharacterized protein
MTAALAVALVVALISIFALLWAARARSARFDDERSRRAEEASSQLGAAIEATVRAEQRAQESGHRCDEQERRALEARGGAQLLWALDKMRSEREWHDVAGPREPMPVPWDDDSIGGAIGIEAAIIREVVGTPSNLEMVAPAVVGDPLAAALLTRVGVEMLHTLARSGEEMTVNVSSRAITVTQPADAFTSLPDLSGLVEAARAAGGQLSVTSSPDSLTTRILLPGADPPADGGQPL